MSIWDFIIFQIKNDWQNGPVLLYEFLRGVVLVYLLNQSLKLPKKLFAYLQTVIKKKPRMLQTYLDQITQTYLRGDAREESYYEIGSGGGISPLPSHRTVREALTSHGSSCF
jgi:hypothetical protein